MLTPVDLPCPQCAGKVRDDVQFAVFRCEDCGHGIAHDLVHRMGPIIGLRVPGRDGTVEIAPELA